MTALEDIPDEILQHILSFVSPQDNLVRVQLLSRRLNHLANEPLLWRSHCQSSFTYWDSSHSFPAKLAGSVFDVDWKALFLVRKAREARASMLFDGILASKLGRARRFEQICLLGYDAKDFLLEQCRTIDSAKDVLARRYHSQAILASLRRGVALEAWCELRRHTPDESVTGVPAHGSHRLLERALGALDMFVIKDDVGDLDHITQMLDNIAAQFQAVHPDHRGMCTRDAALALNRWLRAQNLTGMDDPQRNYRNLRNCFLGHALRDENHPSLPMISAVIYCCIAGRLGLNAHCCASPGHIHAMVFAPRGLTLDGGRLEDGDQSLVDKMYVDPFNTDLEVDRQALQARIVAIGWQNSMETLLEPVSPATLVERVTRNVKATFTASRAPIVSGDQGVASLLQGNPAGNLELAVYGAAWASLLMTRNDPEEFGEHSRQLAFWFKAHQGEDVWLIDKFFLPLSAQILGTPSPELAQYMRQMDNRPSQPRRRTQDMKYHVGQVVYHARTDKLAVVCGWRKNNGLTFYDIMVENGPAGIVARPENLKLVTDSGVAMSASFDRAGLYFKRFDASTCTFVSNVMEEFPDG